MSGIGPLTDDDPRSIGGYTLTGRVGKGGQGVVYHGRAPDGAPVAVKTLHGGTLDITGMRRQLAEEVELAQRVARFCTAQILAADIDAEPPYIISEYIEGPTLREVVRTSGPMRGASLERLAIGTLTALAAIHQAGVVHRDLKPGNVLMGSDGPRVIDFGIARALEGTAILTSSVAGTPAYMAPEQIAGRAMGPAVDLFAWAAMIVYAANGSGPFGHDSLQAVLHRVTHDPPELGDLEGHLRTIADRCLEKDPASRPTAAETLMSLLGGGTVPARPESVEPAAVDHASGAAEEAPTADATRTPAPGRPGAAGVSATGPTAEDAREDDVDPTRGGPDTPAPGRVGTTEVGPEPTAGPARPGADRSGHEPGDDQDPTGVVPLQTLAAGAVAAAAPEARERAATEVYQSHPAVGWPLPGTPPPRAGASVPPGTPNARPSTGPNPPPATGPGAPARPGTRPGHGPRGPESAGRAPTGPGPAGPAPGGPAGPPPGGPANPPPGRGPQPGTPASIAADVRGRGSGHPSPPASPPGPPSGHPAGPPPGGTTGPPAPGPPGTGSPRPGTGPRPSVSFGPQPSAPGPPPGAPAPPPPGAPGPYGPPGRPAPPDPRWQGPARPPARSDGPRVGVLLGVLGGLVLLAIVGFVVLVLLLRVASA